MERPEALMEERRAFNGLDLRERLEARASGGSGRQLGAGLPARHRRRVSVCARIRGNRLQGLEGDGGSGCASPSLWRDSGSWHLCRWRPRRRRVGQRLLQRGPPGSGQSMEFRCPGRLAREDRAGRTAAVALLSLAPAPGSVRSVPDELSASQLPWPPSAGAVPPMSACGSQRRHQPDSRDLSGWNGLHGLRAHFNGRYAFWSPFIQPGARLERVVAERAGDGCDVGLPRADARRCRAGSTRAWIPRPTTFRRAVPTVVLVPVASRRQRALRRHHLYNYSRGHPSVRFDGRALATATSGGTSRRPSFSTTGPIRSC